MDKTLAGLIGAVGSLAAVAPAQAVTVPHLDTVMQADSYADLLRPIPNATAVLQAADAKAEAEAATADVMQVQYYHHHHHYYHHHHHSYYRRPVYGYRYYHHHHHHHHFRRIFVPGVGWIIR